MRASSGANAACRSPPRISGSAAMSPCSPWARPPSSPCRLGSRVPKLALKSKPPESCGTARSPSPDSALDVADHLVAKLAALGDADSQLDTWLDQVLAKVPETASGELADALNALDDTASACAADLLRARWTAARDALAAALPAAGAETLLRELALARSRTRSALAALPPANANAISTFLDAPATPPPPTPITSYPTSPPASASSSRATPSCSPRAAPRPACPPSASAPACSPSPR